MIGGSAAWIAWLPVFPVAAFLLIRVRAGAWRILGVLFLVTYCFWIVSVALFPIPIGGRAGMPDIIGSLSINLVPFERLLEVLPHLPRGQIIRQHGGNFVLLMPFTILLPALWPRLRAWKWALAIGLGASAAIELLQLIFSAIVGFGYRSVDIDDVIVNTAGALVGYALFLSLHALMGRRGPVRHPAG